MDSLKITRETLALASKEHRQVTADELSKLQAAILEDELVTLEEAGLLKDGLTKKRFAASEMPAVHALITQSLTDSRKPLTLTVGKQVFSDVKAAREGLTLDQLKAILNDNKVDEVYVGTPDGKIFVAHGVEARRGALNLDQVKSGYIGEVNGQQVMVLHVDNETNTAKEGAKAPIKGTLSVVKTASESGIVKGVTEMGTAVVTIVIGKSVLEKGIDVVKTAGKAAAPKVAEEVVEETAKKVSPKLVAKGVKDMVVSGAANFGVAVGVTAAVVGVVAGGLAGVGAIYGSRTKPNMETLKMATQ